MRARKIKKECSFRQKTVLACLIAVALECCEIGATLHESGTVSLVDTGSNVACMSASPGTLYEANEAFEHGEFRRAVFDDYQWYRNAAAHCDSRLRMSRPMMGRFLQAIDTAVHGEYRRAYIRMRQIEVASPSSDAGYLTGVFAWISGRPEDAENAWQETIVKNASIASMNRAPDVALMVTRAALEWSRTQNDQTPTLVPGTKNLYRRADGSTFAIPLE